MKYLRYFILPIRIFYKMIFKSTIVVLFIAVAQTVILQLPSSPWKKCYYTQHSPDKTLEVKMGLVKKQPNPCHVRFQVSFKDGADRVVEIIHEKDQKCQEGRFRQSYMVKHTPNQQLSQLVSGYYEICVIVMQNQNTEIYAEIFIGQKLNPIIYEHSENPLPLVEASQLVDLDLNVQSIKRGLIKSRIHANAIKKHGDQLQVKIQKLMSLNQMINLGQIGALIVFGLTWIMLVKKLKIKSTHR